MGRRAAGRGGGGGDRGELGAIIKPRYGVTLHET